MQIHVTGHHLEVTDSLHAYIDSKFEKLDRFFHKVNRANVVLNVEKVQQIAEATISVNNGEIHAKAENSDMYAAIDALTDKLVRQLSKHKDKLTHH